ncbi:MAG: MBOAT family protein [Verrucomicrobia bacterium]|nr:MBOAT family protein [Verrucomicrobiota bacterium]
MLFNSGTFLQFFAAFLLLFYLCRNNLGARNLLIVAASYFFYGWWDYRFLSLLVLTSLVDFFVGLGLERAASDKRRKLLLCVSLAANLSVLGFFKYFDFFVESFAALLERLHLPVHPRTLGIILPVGISFYTFQSMSYIVDVYRRQMKPTRSLVNFLAYVSFFPQLVAGPIERGHHLLPQFETTLRITRAMLAEGLWLALWGMFKKVVLADNLAPLVEMVYENPAATGPMVVLATVAFGFQIYCDFSGYSDIARGTAKVLGFDIMVNFNLPYSATSLREFWRRWHISLSTWLRDYLYVGLGGNRLGRARTYVNLLVTMLLGGLWHGAAWNFVLWGLWHGAGLALNRWWEEARGPQRRFSAALAWLLTMLCVLYGWLLFRAGAWAQVCSLHAALANWTLPSWWQSYLTNLLAFTLPLVLLQVWQARTGNLLVPLRQPAWTQAVLQGALLLAIVLFWEKKSTPFIYFQF